MRICVPPTPGGAARYVLHGPVFEAALELSELPLVALLIDEGEALRDEGELKLADGLLQLVHLVVHPAQRHLVLALQEAEVVLSRVELHLQDERPRRAG